MSDSRSVAVEGHTQLSPAEVRHIERACDGFEAEWQAGRPPRPEEYLGAADEPVRSALFRQLLLLDWDYRRREGDDPAVGEYVARFPADADLIEEVHRELTESTTATRGGADGSDARSTDWSFVADFCEGESSARRGSGCDKYDLVNELGQGGIGVVFRGRDRHLGRMLAVKVLREAYRDKPEARRRFIAEARIGSQLQHPAIVPVYEQGWLDDRRPYFTMKLVEGHTLAALLRDRAEPGQDLPRFLGVFEQVCQAMAYAHARGVVHRDLKPANVMVGAFGEVQVMDWGFAKRLWHEDVERTFPDSASTREPQSAIRNAAGVSQSGIMMGTPAYMPPEQARGESGRIGPRADVFALGAILCEILTGRPPYAGRTADEIWRRAADGDLGDAFARLADCKADDALRDLSRRCLAADDGQRPVDAEVVARTLTSYLASAQERLRKAQVDRAAAEAREQAARSRAQVERRARRLILALAVALLCGTGVAVWEAVVANRAKHDAQNAAAAQTKAKEMADAKEAETRAVLDFVQIRILAAARPERQKGGLGWDVTLQTALEAALPAVDKSFARQPLTEARLRMMLGESFRHLGKARIAAEQSERARAIYAERLGAHHPDTLRSTNNLASCYVRLGRPGEAVKLYEETLAGMVVKLGPDHPDSLKAMQNLAGCYASLGRHADALKLNEQTLASRRVRLGPDHPDALGSMHNLAISYHALGRYADALKLHEEALAGLKAKLGPDHPDTLRCMHNLANTQSALGLDADALRLRQQTLDLRTARLGPDHPDTLKSMHNLANSYTAVGRHAEAVKLHEETLARRQTDLGPDHPETLRSMHNLANSYYHLGRQLDALKLREDVLWRRQRKLGPAHPDTLSSMHNLAVSYHVLQRYADAQKLLEQTVALRRANLGADHPDTLHSLANLASLYADLGRHTQALQIRDQALGGLKVRLGPDHPETLRCMYGLADSLTKLDRGAEAVPLIDDCLRRGAGQAGVREVIKKVTELRLRYFEKGRDVGGCRATAEIWERLQRTDADSLYFAACFRAVTAAVIRATDTSPSAARQAEAEAERAVAWLKKAVAAGYKNAAHIENDPDLDPLRDGAEFRNLVAWLKGGK